MSLTTLVFPNFPSLVQVYIYSMALFPCYPCLWWGPWQGYRYTYGMTLPNLNTCTGHSSQVTGQRLQVTGHTTRNQYSSGGLTYTYTQKHALPSHLNSILPALLLPTSFHFPFHPPMCTYPPTTTLYSLPPSLIHGAQAKPKTWNTMRCCMKTSCALSRLVTTPTSASVMLTGNVRMVWRGSVYVEMDLPSIPLSITRRRNATSSSPSIVKAGQTWVGCQPHDLTSPHLTPPPLHLLCMTRLLLPSLHATKYPNMTHAT